MVVSVTVESPLNDEVRALIAALNEYLRPLSPTEFQFQVTVDEMAEPDTTVFVARNGLGRAVACGALKTHAGGLGEVKRMFTVPEARGAGVGSEILAAIIARARSAGLTWLMLETGASPGFAAAWALYESNGFTRRGRFSTTRPVSGPPTSSWT